jgi:preprotein translocase subunit SecG
MAGPICRVRLDADPGQTGRPAAPITDDADHRRPSKANMILFLQILLVITSLALMALILLHRGKGGGLSSLFGGTMQSSLSGSSVVEKNLDRLTLFVAAIWAISIVGVGLLLKVGA